MVMAAARVTARVAASAGVAVAEVFSSARVFRRVSAAKVEATRVLFGRTGKTVTLRTTGRALAEVAALKTCAGRAAGSHRTRPD